MLGKPRGSRETQGMLCSSAAMWGRPSKCCTKQQSQFTDRANLSNTLGSRFYMHHLHKFLTMHESFHLRRPCMQRRSIWSATASSSETGCKTSPTLPKITVGCAAAAIVRQPEKEEPIFVNGKTQISSSGVRGGSLRLASCGPEEIVDSSHPRADVHALARSVEAQRRRLGCRALGIRSPSAFFFLHLRENLVASIVVTVVAPHAVLSAASSDIGERPP